jgi:hypothetical protein
MLLTLEELETELSELPKLTLLEKGELKEREEDNVELLFISET